MRWPWVSRAAYERATVECDHLRASWDQERARYEALVKIMVDLKRERFVSPEPVPTVPDVEPLPPEIQAALDQRVPEAGKERDAVGLYAVRRLHETNDVDVVASEILDGADLDGWR